MRVRRRVAPLQGADLPHFHDLQRTSSGLRASCCRLPRGFAGVAHLLSCHPCFRSRPRKVRQQPWSWAGTRSCCTVPLRLGVLLPAYPAYTCAFAVHSRDSTVHRHRASIGQHIPAPAQCEVRTMVNVSCDFHVVTPMARTTAVTVWPCPPTSLRSLPVAATRCSCRIASFRCPRC